MILGEIFKNGRLILDAIQESICSLGSNLDNLFNSGGNVLLCNRRKKCV